MSIPRLALVVQMLLTGCKGPNDTDDTGAEPTHCELLGLTERPFQEAEHDRTLYALAADLTIPTLDGDWTLSEGWTGCDNYLFIQDLPRQDQSAPISIWERDLDDLFEQLPRNVHLFFMSTLADQEDRDQAIAVQKNHFAGFRVLHIVFKQRGELFIPIGKLYLNSTLCGDRIEDCHRHLVADTDQVADIDQRVDRGDVSFFGQTAQQGFHRTAVPGRVDTKLPES